LKDQQQFPNNPWSSNKIAIAGAMYCHKKASVPPCGVLVAKSPEKCQLRFQGSRWHVCVGTWTFQAGIVLSQEDYLYSRAVNYADLPDTLIDVILI